MVHKERRYFVIRPVSGVRIPLHDFSAHLGRRMGMCHGTRSKAYGLADKIFLNPVRVRVAAFDEDNSNAPRTASRDSLAGRGPRDITWEWVA